MKTILLLFLSINFVWAAEILPPIKPLYPTQKSLTPVPGTIPPDESPFEKAVEEAGEIPVEATETTSTSAKTETSENKRKKTSRENRENTFGTVMLGYQLITTWIPSKKTISYTQNFNEKWSLEGEYAWSTLDYPIIGVDLGAISEKRISLMAKYYPSNSFHFALGPYFNDFEAQAGSDILNKVSGTRTTSSFGVEGVGITGGIGNRWQWSNGFTVGIDWFRLNVPLIVTEVDSEILSAVTNREDDEDIRKVIRRFNRIPTFVLFGLNIGYSF